MTLTKMCWSEIRKMCSVMDLPGYGSKESRIVLSLDKTKSLGHEMSFERVYLYCTNRVASYLLPDGEKK